MNINLHLAAQSLTWALGAVIDAEFYLTHGMDHADRVKAAREYLAAAEQKLSELEAATGKAAA